MHCVSLGVRQGGIQVRAHIKHQMLQQNSHHVCSASSLYLIHILIQSGYGEPRLGAWDCGCPLPMACGHSSPHRPFLLLCWPGYGLVVQQEGVMELLFVDKVDFRPGGKLALRQHVCL